MFARDEMAEEGDHVTRFPYVAVTTGQGLDRSDGGGGRGSGGMACDGGDSEELTCRLGGPAGASRQGTHTERTRTCEGGFTLRDKADRLTMLVNPYNEV